jgi:hypothetical protein
MAAKLPSLSPLEEGVASRRLLTAVIRRAVLDFVLYRDVKLVDNEAQYTLALEAASWLFSPDASSLDAAGRYTFLHICNLLELDHESLRTAVLKLTREDAVRRFSGNGEV